MGCWHASPTSCRTGELVLQPGKKALVSAKGTWPIADILGAKAIPGSGGELIIYRCGRRGRMGAEPTEPAADFKSADARIRRLTQHSFTLADDSSAAAWERKLNRAARSGNGCHTEEEGAPRRLLCVINPASGHKKAEIVFEKHVRPVFDAAGAILDVRTTARAGDASDWAQKMLVSDYDGIVVCGGDGTLHEVIAGLTARRDAECACKKIALAHIPAGSGNAIAVNVAAESNEAYDPVTAAYLAVKGTPCAIDAALTWDSRGHVRPLILIAEWGLVADVDFESEHLRFMGHHRFTVTAFQRIMSLRRYPGKIMFLPADNSEEFSTDPSDFFRLCSASHRQCTGLVEESPSPFRQLKPNATSDSWQSLEGNFNLCVACNAAWIDKRTPMAPSARLSDGALTLVVSRDMKRRELLVDLLKAEEGKHIARKGNDGLPRSTDETATAETAKQKNPPREIRIRAMRLMPDVAAASAIGVDGEVISQAEEQGSMLDVVCYPGVLRMFMAP